MKKLILAVIVLGVLGTLTYYVAKYLIAVKAMEAMDPTPTTQVVKVDIDENVSATGFVQPIVTTEIRSEINGKIAKIYVEDGSVVKEGDILLELDKTSLESENSKASNEYSLQKLTLEQEERDFQRQEELMKKGFAIAKDFDDAKTSLRKAKIQLEVKKAEWEKAQDNLSKTSILAPQSGTITDMNLTPGQVIVGAGSVSEGTLLMKVSSLENLYVEVKINEIEVEKIKAVKEPDISFDSMGDLRFKGEVIYVSPYAKNENNIRVFPVKVAFTAVGGRVRPGISANIEFPVKKVKDVCAVILSAVYAEDKVKYVFAKRGDGMWEKRRVETGINDIKYVEITKGLKEGETVALSFPKKNLASDEIVDFAE